MSGILDSKSRVIDTIITIEGRRQLANGGIDIQYVTFTDGAAFYKADIASGSQDATQRLYLEACQLPQDDVTFQADDSGNLQTFRNDQGIQSNDGRILDYSFTALTSSVLTGSSLVVNTLSGSDFSTAADALLNASLDNFKKLYVVATKDPLFEDDGFAAGPNDVSFQVTNNRPIPDPRMFATHVSSLDSIFSDPRFSNAPNFKYLPPINKVRDKSLDKTDHRVMSPYHVGFFPPMGRTQVFGLSYAQVKFELQYYERMGYMRTINFDPTSADNNIVGQFFEKNYNHLRKLDVIDYGKHNTGDTNAPVAHIFFVGKVEVDEKGTDTFLHLFTLVFE